MMNESCGASTPAEHTAGLSRLWPLQDSARVPISEAGFDFPHLLSSHRGSCTCSLRLEGPACPSPHPPSFPPDTSVSSPRRPPGPQALSPGTATQRGHRGASLPPAGLPQNISTVRTGLLCRSMCFCIPLPRTLWSSTGVNTEVTQRNAAAGTQRAELRGV